MTHSWQNVIVFVDATVETRVLSLNVISEGSIERHAIINRLCEQGLSDARIAEELNNIGMFTPTGLEYYSELVFVTRRKYSLRQLRKKDHNLTIRNVQFFIDQNN